MLAARFKVLVCRGPTCGPTGPSESLRACLEHSVAACGLKDQVVVEWQSCFGRCSQAPNLLVRELASGQPPLRSAGLATLPAPKGRAALYSRLSESGIVQIVREHLLGGRVVRPLLSAKPQASGAAEPAKPQHRLPQVLAAARGIPEGE